MSESTLRNALTLGLQNIKEDPAHHPIEQYLSYISLLLQWNKAYNLTAITEPDKIISNHIIDSLSVLPYIKGNNCLDVGSGAGLPGLILALARPECNWTLLDSNSKKTRFLNQAVLELKPENVTVVHSRVNAHKSEQGYSTVISRAYSSLMNFFDETRRLSSSEGILIAMKGSIPQSELDEFSQHYAVENLKVIEIENLNQQRHLVII